MEKCIMKAILIKTREMVQVEKGSESLYRDINTHGIYKKVYTASELEFLDVTMKGWIARDRLNNGLFLYNEKPYRAFSGYQTDGKEDEWKSETCSPFPLPSESFPSLTWQDEPEKVTVKIII